MSFFTGRSKKGKIPLVSTKINQDRYTIQVDPDTNTILLLVLDGHGDKGHIISDVTVRIIKIVYR